MILNHVSVLPEAELIQFYRESYDYAMAHGYQAQANRLYAVIARYTSALLPICPCCRHSSLCRCDSPAPLPIAEEEVIPIFT